jgi:intermediate cleaving peptidase 55
MYRSGAVFHPYRQDSNMLYLTGFNEADSFAAIQRTGPNPDDFAFHLYVLPKDELAEQWAGPRSGVQAALDVFNADEADAVENAGTRIAELVRSATAVYADLDRPAPGKTTGALYRLLEEEVARGTIDVAQRQAVRALAPIVNLLRAIKSPAEVANMRRAGQLSGRVMTDAMRRAWTHERGLHAFLDSGFVAAGLEGPAYIPVVASGLNANVIHYVHNNNVVQPNDMILVDAGGEYGTYVTDISRTWPAAGRFTPAQRDLYQAVLDVQRAGVSLCRANSGLSLHDIHLRTVRDLTTRLADIGFPVNEANINVLFPHHVGHYVGLDVHDVPGYSRNERLRPGHCVTIEPGVYVPDDERWPKHFRGMGIRIEDSVCVQDEHPLVLTTEAVKEVVDIEALRD